MQAACHVINMAAIEVENVQAVEESSEEDEIHEENNVEDPPRPNRTTEESATTPQLPNLAVAALRRLAANRDDESPDDFRPLKRRRLHTKTEGKESDNTATDNENIDEVKRFMERYWAVQ